MVVLRVEISERRASIAPTRGGRAQLARGNNRGYMLQKWGGVKSAGPEVSEARWGTPFNAGVPLKWWQARANPGRPTHREWGR